MLTQSEKLGTEKVGKLLYQMSLPAAIAMMVNGLYNVVDTIFIGQGVGPLAIGGLAIAFPIQMLIMGFAQMVGIGAASAVSRNLGADEIEKADQVAGNAFTSIFVLSLLFSLVGLVFADQLLYIFGATETLLPYAKEYITVILFGSVFFSFAMMSNSLIRAEGNAKVAMITMLLGAGLNIILDPIFIFVFDLGIRGAALATIISQFISFLYVMNYMYSGKSSLKVKLHHLKPDWKIIKEIFTVGFSAFTRSSTNSIFSIVVNNSLRIFGGDIAITIFGIVNRVIAFLFMPILGVVQGMQPIAGFNYGAKKIERVKHVLKLSIIASTVIAILGWIIGETIPHIIIRAFTDDVNIIKDGSYVFRIVIAMVPLLGIQFVGATLFQSLGKAMPAIVLSLLRQFILLIPLILILPRIFNLQLFGVWLAFPIADILAAIITAYVLKKEMYKISLEANEV
ncbi:MATE family efflux transporter [Alkaliphilus hydrothermalis]|uniref:Multidrug export protein MepA n=1 Tax=Alkaliphilus hydrothermalis TaxID=1482730 RepID=A0ABS2NMH2_9FIRM|nr:MATE family efflux transporter [Alkaliphilus hydrothermalis]MBM7614153.1 putative MATE family efflux protein [Alkaliphilus hydrothermalis]